MGFRAHRERAQAEIRRFRQQTPIFGAYPNVSRQIEVGSAAIQKYGSGLALSSWNQAHRITGGNESQSTGSGNGVL